MKLSAKLIQLTLSFVFVFGVFANAEAADFPKFIQKKIDKTVKKTFVDQEVDFEALNVTSSLAYENLHNVKIKVLKSENQPIGFAGFASSKGKNDDFDYMVLFDNDLKILKVVVLVYRSSYGGEIMAKSWLKQFVGKSSGENMEFDKDIDSISGATISAPAITKGIKALSLLMTEVLMVND